MFKDIINLLDCNLFSSVGINYKANNTITSFANDFLDSVSTHLSIFCEEFCFWHALLMRIHGSSFGDFDECKSKGCIYHKSEKCMHGADIV